MLKVGCRQGAAQCSQGPGTVSLPAEESRMNSWHCGKHFPKNTVMCAIAGNNESGGDGERHESELRGGTGLVPAAMLADSHEMSLLPHTKAGTS